MVKLPSGQTLLTILAVSTAASVAFATKGEFNKRRLTSAYNEAQRAVAQLQQERSQLSTELTQTKETVSDQAGRLTQLQTELEGLQARLEQTGAELAQLRQRNTDLSQQLVMTTQEKETLQAKLSDLKELKAAIRSVKRRLQWERWQAYVARIDAQRKTDQVKLAQGNRGLVVRSGVSTVRGVGSAASMQVRVLEPAETR